MLSDVPKIAPGNSFPGEYYTSDAFYAHESRWLRQRMWHVVGHESEIPEAGDFFLYEFDKESVIVLRDELGAIRAHLNVCRHRGSRICRKPAGNVRALSCPYHAWSYALDGTLRVAPFAPRGFSKSAYALHSCHVEVGEGLIFVNLGETPPEFQSFVGFMGRELELSGVRDAKVAARRTFTVAANWKLVVQNNLECYHCRPAHPTYCAAHPGASLERPPEAGDRALRYDSVTNSLKDDQLSKEQARQFRPIYSGPDGLNFHYIARQRIGGEFETESVGGRRVAPWLGQSTIGVQTLAVPSPLTSIVLNPDYAIVYNFVPRALQSTDITAIWLVREDAKEGVDYRLEDVTAVWDPTLREDKALAESVQCGVRSEMYRPGPYIETEVLVENFDRWYVRRILGGDARS